MDRGIRGRKAVVNGGSAGMGKEAAFALAREGVDLVLSARGEARLRATADEIAAATGVTVLAVVADHSRREGLERICAACPAPDILVATCSPPPMTEDYRQIDAQQWRANLDTGLWGPIDFMKVVLDGMVERRWGPIINIATIAAKYPLELRTLSGAPRAALMRRRVARGAARGDDQQCTAGHVPNRLYAGAIWCARTGPRHDLRGRSGKIRRGLSDRGVPLWRC
jgi:3-oxoacyl-[acyl-carrier protein] reductase